jgi:PBP1b-binding outer membrane lipoprotein LpoB
MMPNKTTATFLTCTLLLAGCSSSPREVTRTQPAATPAPARTETKQNLRKGMTEADIRSAWGEPLAAHPGKEPGETILVYEFDLLTTQRMVAASMVERPAIDPINGADRTVMEPVLAPQNVTVTQTIVLQLKDGKLASWARQLGEERSFN